MSKKTRRGEFWVKPEQKPTSTLTGGHRSPRSFMNTETARKLLVIEKTIIHEPNKSIGVYRCFSNNKIEVSGIIKVDITSGSSSAKNCMILLVDNSTINIMRRDVTDQLGLRLTMTKPNIKGEKNLLNISNTPSEFLNGYSPNTLTYVQD